MSIGPRGQPVSGLAAATVPTFVGQKFPKKLCLLSLKKNRFFLPGSGSVKNLGTVYRSEKRKTTYICVTALTHLQGESEVYERSEPRGSQRQNAAHSLDYGMKLPRPIHLVQSTPTGYGTFCTLIVFILSNLMTKFRVFVPLLFIFVRRVIGVVACKCATHNFTVFIHNQWLGD